MITKFEILLTPDPTGLHHPTLGNHQEIRVGVDAEKMFWKCAAFRPVAVLRKLNGLTCSSNNLLWSVVESLSNLGNFEPGFSNVVCLVYKFCKMYFLSAVKISKKFEFPHRNTYPHCSLCHLYICIYLCHVFYFRIFGPIQNSQLWPSNQVKLICCLFSKFK